MSHQNKPSGRAKGSFPSDESFRDIRPETGQNISQFVRGTAAQINSHPNAAVDNSYQNVALSREMDLGVISTNACCTPLENPFGTPWPSDSSFLSHSKSRGGLTCKCQHDDCLSFPGPTTTNKLLARGPLAPLFPERLHKLLEDAEANGWTDIISWQPHGRCFCVHNKNRLMAEILPFYFKMGQFASFSRQLSMYGFRRLKYGADRGCYYHPGVRTVTGEEQYLFLRGRPDLAIKIKRVPQAKDADTGRSAINREIFVTRQTLDPFMQMALPQDVASPTRILFADQQDERKLPPRPSFSMPTLRSRSSEVEALEDETTRHGMRNQEKAASTFDRQAFHRPTTKRHATVDSLLGTQSSDSLLPIGGARGPGHHSSGVVGESRQVSEALCDGQIEESIKPTSYREDIDSLDASVSGLSLEEQELLAGSLPAASDILKELSDFH